MVAIHPNFKKNNFPFKSDMAIIVTSWDGHLMFLKKSLQKYIETKKYVICAYDSHGEYPASDVMTIPNSWVFKHHTYGATKRNGWLWNIIYAASVIKEFNFKYVFCNNSDCIFEKPENVDKLVDILDNNDIISSSSNGIIHTCSMLFKIEPFLNFVYYIKKNIKNNVPESYSPEVLLRDFTNKYCIKNKVPEIMAIYPEHNKYAGAIDHYSSYNQDSTWKRIIGFRNLGGELKTACQEHLDPPPKKYFDLREKGRYLNQHERTTLYYYYTTGDRRWLYKYWAEGEDSDFNRRYYTIDYYGNKPIYDDSKRKELGPPSERLEQFDRTNYMGYVLKD